VESEGGKKMITKTLLYALVCIVAVLAGAGSFADDAERYELYLPSPNEELLGTWVNTAYPGNSSTVVQKMVYYHWGAYELYEKADHADPARKGTTILMDKWKDAEGNIWYKAYDRESWTKTGYFAIYRINKNGTMIEKVWDSREFPSESDLNPTNPYYHIYYRQ
jgi:hypothetical protein